MIGFRLGFWFAVFVIVSTLLSACASGESDLSFEPDGLSANVIEAGPMDSNRPTVLLLHGASFDAKTWEQLGVLGALGDRNIRSVAVDLPGRDVSMGSAERADFLRQLIRSVDVGRGVVVVSPSMSGSYSLALIAEDGPDSMTGFVAVAPVGIDQFAASMAGPVSLETLVIWGDNDDVIPLEEAEVLRDQFYSAELKVISDAGHAPYQAKPLAFVDLIKEFVALLV